MAENVIRPAIKLPPEMKTRLTNLEGEIASAEAGMASLKRMGLDTTMLEERLEWAKMVRKTLLTDFG
jgi:hypothetical protein